MRRHLLWLLAAAAGCAEPTPEPPADASAAVDATLASVDAGPLTYETYEDFSRDACDDSGSLTDVPLLGKWSNTTAEGSEFSSYVLRDNGVYRGILDAIAADVVVVDSNNLFLHRTYNLTSMAIHLCAVASANTLSGQLATCNGAICNLTTVEATLVEPMTD